MQVTKGERIMNGYLCFFEKQKIEVYATSTVDAMKLALKYFRVRPNKAYLVTVLLAEKDHKPVVHTPDF